MAQFSTEFPFDQIVAAPSLGDDGAARLYEWVGAYPHKASATRGGFNRFCELLDDVKAPWKGALVEFTQKIRSGTFKREFKQTYNRRAGGGCSPECSQTSEMFSLFSQAVGYHQ